MVSWVRLIAVVAVTMSALPGIPVAHANIKPVVSFSFTTTRIDAGTDATLTYSGVHLPRPALLKLQEQQGRAHVWRNVRTLKGRTGTVQFSEALVGRYQFRVAAIRKHELVAASRVQTLYAYGNVYFKTFCHNGSVVPQNLSGSCPEGTAQVGGHVIEYVAFGSAHDDYPEFRNWLDFSKSTCRSVTITFGITDARGQSDDTSYVKVVTATRDPQVSSTPFGILDSFTAQLDGRPWDLDVSDNASNDREMVVNGIVSCYTVSGR